MTKVSRYKMNRKLEKKLVGNFWNLLGKVRKGEAEEFFGSFFTPTEILMFSKRLEILKRLYKKESYSKIKMELKVTNATITKMSNILHRASKKFLSLLSRSE